MGNTASAAESVASGITHVKVGISSPPLPAHHHHHHGVPPPECPMHQKAATTPANSECPINAANDNSDINPYNLMPPANQNPAPGQPFPLPTDRQTSTIPKVTQEGKEYWVYPSQQMFWNAMLRKGWKWQEGDIKKTDMDAIIKIHNINNENAWQVVLMWEAAHARECGNPRLKSFGGKATSYSPRARFWRLFGYDYPFDRHDWIVDRCGKDVRYIIDYYDGGVGHKYQKVAVLDVRPAMDSFENVWDRLKAGYLLFKDDIRYEFQSLFS